MTALGNQLSIPVSLGFGDECQPDLVVQTIGGSFCVLIRFSSFSSTSVLTASLDQFHPVSAAHCGSQETDWWGAGASKTAHGTYTSE